jgi:glycosyltransferase involved in cell wall biosynthesis
MPAEQSHPLVSVAIPTFNRPVYLRLAIDSALKQTFKNIEVIVQDNASVEDPTPMLSALGDSRVRSYRNSASIGQTANILGVCTKATGKYIAILGDDDLWQPDFLATLVAPLEDDPEIVVSFCAHDYIDDQGRLNAVKTEAVNRRHRHRLPQGVHGPFVVIALVNRSICTISAAVFRREAIDWHSIPKELAYGCDNYINYLAARTGRRCYYHPARLAQVRLLARSASAAPRASVADKQMNARSSLFCWDTFYRDSAVSDGHRYFAMKRADNAIRIILCSLWLGGWRTMLREFRVSLHNAVIRPRALLYHFIYGWH